MFNIYRNCCLPFKAKNPNRECKRKRQGNKNLDKDNLDDTTKNTSFAFSY